MLHTGGGSGETNSSFNLILKQVFIEKNWNRSNVVTAGIIIYLNFFVRTFIITTNTTINSRNSVDFAGIRNQ